MVYFRLYSTHRDEREAARSRSIFTILPELGYFAGAARSWGILPELGYFAGAARSRGILPELGYFAGAARSWGILPELGYFAGAARSRGILPELPGAVLYSTYLPYKYVLPFVSWSKESLIL